MGKSKSKVKKKKRRMHAAAVKNGTAKKRKVFGKQANLVVIDDLSKNNQ
ncbi:hypothetical protein [Enterococcus saccharolyticus]